MDWRVAEGSTIAGLPKLVQPLALIARNAKSLVPKKPPYRSDSITTFNPPAFLDDPLFQRAYARAVKASGWDYGIHYRVHQLLWCAAQARHIEGDFVELGTGRGFMMSALMEADSSRPLHLFDTFAPAYVSGDGQQVGVASPYYATSLNDVAANFAEWTNARLYPGDVFETLPAARLSKVAFLHIDLNSVEPEVFGLKFLWPSIPRGGGVLLDDYGHQCHVPQREAMDALAGELGFAILSTPTGQGIIIK